MEKIIKWWASNPVAANLLMLICFIGGIVSYVQIERELDPYVEFPGAWTYVAWPGASPQDVEEQIIVRMEEALSEIDGIIQANFVSLSQQDVIALNTRRKMFEQNQANAIKINQRSGE